MVEMREVMTDEQRDNCRLLAGFLFELPKNRLYMRAFVGDGWGGKPDLSCGTSACAAGWATTIPHFRAKGLRLHSYSEVEVNRKTLEKLFGRAHHVFYMTELTNPKTVAMKLLSFADYYGKYIR